MPPSRNADQLPALVRFCRWRGISPNEVAIAAEQNRARHPVDETRSSRVTVLLPTGVLQRQDLQRNRDRPSHLLRIGGAQKMTATLFVLPASHHLRQGSQVLDSRQLRASQIIGEYRTNL